MVGLVTKGFSAGFVGDKIISPMYITANAAKNNVYKEFTHFLGYYITEAFKDPNNYQPKSLNQLEHDYLFNAWVKESNLGAHYHWDKNRPLSIRKNAFYFTFVHEVLSKPPFDTKSNLPNIAIVVVAVYNTVTKKYLTLRNICGRWTFPTKLQLYQEFVDDVAHSALNFSLGIPLEDEVHFTNYQNNSFNGELELNSLVLKVDNNFRYFNANPDLFNLIEWVTKEELFDRLELDLLRTDPEGIVNELASILESDTEDESEATTILEFHKKARDKRVLAKQRRFNEIESSFMPATYQFLRTLKPSDKTGELNEAALGTLRETMDNTLGIQGTEVKDEVKVHNSFNMLLGYASLTDMVKKVFGTKEKEPLVLSITEATKPNVQKIPLLKKGYWDNEKEGIITQKMIIDGINKELGHPDFSIFPVSEITLKITPTAYVNSQLPLSLIVYIKNGAIKNPEWLTKTLGEYGYL